MPLACTVPGTVHGDHNVKDTVAPPAEGLPKPDGAPGADTVGQGEKNELLEWIKSAVIAVALFFVIRTFLIQAYTIPSGSMEETLLIGDYLMANNAIFGAQIPDEYFDPSHKLS